MKRKLLLMIVALLCSLGTWADDVTIDITSKRITNANLSSLTGWTFDDSFAAAGNDYTDYKTDGDVNVVEFYSEWSANPSEMTSKNFKMVQTVSLTAGTYRLSSYGFYREKNGDGTNTKAYIKAGSNTQYINGLSSAGVGSYSGSNDLYKAANAFSSGDFNNTLEFTLASKQDIEIGIVGTFNTQCSWCIIGPMTLVKVLEDGIEVTDAIANAEVASTDNWTGATTNSGEKYTGAPDNYYFDACNWWADKTFDMNQTISNLPQGCYELKVATRAREDFPNSYIYVSQSGSHIKEVSVNKNNGEGGTLGNGWSWTDFRFIKPNNNDFTIGFYAACGGDGRWAGADDFHLYYLGEVPTDDDKTAFTSALTAANSKTLGFESGEYAPYANVAAISALIAANDLDSDLATKAELTSATSAIGVDKWTANDGEVNAVYNPTFALSTNDMTAKGWGSNDGTVIGNESGSYHSRALVNNANLAAMNGTKSALYLRFDGTASNVSTIYNYGTMTGYTMPLKAGTIYRVKADAAVWSTDGTQFSKGLRIAILNSSSTEVGGQTLTTPNSSMGGGSTDKISYDFLFCPAADGNYTLTVDNMAETSTGIVVSNFELKKAASQTLTLPSATPYAAGTYPSVTLDRTFDYTDRWYTLCVPFAFDASLFESVKELDDVKASGDHVTLIFAEASSIEAGKPYLVKPKTANFNALNASNVTLNPAASAGSTEKTGDDYTVTYVGTYEGTTLTAASADGNAWIVSNNNLYNVDSDVTVGAYRAYFTLDEAAESGIKGLSFDFNGVNAINSIESDKMTIDNSAIYNLAGQRVQKAQKGLYIVNGRKVVIK